MTLDPKKISKIPDEDLSDLFDEIAPILEHAYQKGIGVAINQLGPLNVAVTTKMGNKLSSAALARIKELNSKYVNDLADRYEKIIYDIVYEGMEKGQTLKQISDIIVETTGKSIVESRRYAGDVVATAARRSEIELFKDVGIELYRWISVIDGKTCAVCLGLNGRIYRQGYDERGWVNYDTREFIVDDIAQLAQEAGLQDWIEPSDVVDTHLVHDHCRCEQAPVITFEDYKGKVQQTISEVE